MLSAIAFMIVFHGMASGQQMVPLVEVTFHSHCSRKSLNFIATERHTLCLRVRALPN